MLVGLTCAPFVGVRPLAGVDPPRSPHSLMFSETRNARVGRNAQKPMSRCKGQRIDVELPLRHQLHQLHQGQLVALRTGILTLFLSSSHRTGLFLGHSSHNSETHRGDILDLDLTPMDGVVVSDRPKLLTEPLEEQTAEFLIAAQHAPQCPTTVEELQSVFRTQKVQVLTLRSRVRRQQIEILECRVLAYRFRSPRQR